MDRVVNRRLLIALIVFSSAVSASGGSPKNLELIVDGTRREATIYLPEDIVPGITPVVFAFHGHGGSMENAASKFRCEVYWPEAIVVYPQGLNTPVRLTDPQGDHSGWQSNIGDCGDRDLHFFDLLIEYLSQNYSIGTRIYLLGHSNGGIFVYELWAARPEKIAAIASISAILPANIDYSLLRPKPIFHVAGKKDPLVRYEWQLKTFGEIMKINQCKSDGEQRITKNMVKYQSAIDVPFVTYIHDGGHEVPEGIMPLIIEFYKAISN